MAALRPGSHVRPRAGQARRRGLALVLAASTSLAAALAVPAATFNPATAVAAEPSAAPEARPPTCAERFPEEGPAGVDLRLGCIVSELVGLYTPGQVSTPPTISTYAISVVAIVAAIAVAVAVAMRLLARRAGRALASVTPETWWQCPTCRSINGAGVSRCYSCGAARPSDVAVTLATDESPGVPQSFGRGKHG